MFEHSVQMHIALDHVILMLAGMEPKSRDVYIITVGVIWVAFETERLQS